MPHKDKLKEKVSKHDEIQKLRRTVETNSTQIAALKQKVQSLQAELDHVQAKMRG
jgi:chaperonin cofactor prefoldin